MSKDSDHFRNEQRKQAQVDAKIAGLKSKAVALSPPEVAGHQRLVDQRIAALESTRDLSRVWIHVDMVIAKRGGWIQSAGICIVSNQLSNQPD